MERPPPEVKDQVYQNLWNGLPTQQSVAGGSTFKSHAYHIRAHGWTVLEGMADAFRYERAVMERNAAGTSDEPEDGKLHTMALDSLFEFWENSCRESINARTRHLWNPIINTGNDRVDAQDRAENIGRFQSQPAFHYEVNEQGGDIVQERRRVLLEVWACVLAGLMKLGNVPGRRDIFMPRTGSRVLVTGEGCARQVPHNDFESWDARTDDSYFFIITGATEVPLWVMDGSHHFTDFSYETNEDISKHRAMQKLIIPPFSVFFGHGHLTHAGGAYTDRTPQGMSTRVHGYLIPFGSTLSDNVSFNFLTKEKMRTVRFDEDNPLHLPPLFIDPDAWEKPPPPDGDASASMGSGGDVPPIENPNEDEDDDGIVQYPVLNGNNEDNDNDDDTREGGNANTSNNDNNKQSVSIGNISLF